MPIFKVKEGKKGPEGADFSGWNLHTHTPGSITEQHFHDSDELVIVAFGRMLVRTEGVEAVLNPGDSVLTPAGEPHEWLALDEVVSIHVKGRLTGQKRAGHLH